MGGRALRGRSCTTAGTRSAIESRRSGSTTLLVDTYDIVEGVHTAIRVAGPGLGGVRIDFQETCPRSRPRCARSSTNWAPPYAHHGHERPRRVRDRGSRGIPRRRVRGRHLGRHRVRHADQPAWSARGAAGGRRRGSRSRRRRPTRARRADARPRSARSSTASPSSSSRTASSGCRGCRRPPRRAAPAGDARRARRAGYRGPRAGRRRRRARAPPSRARGAAGARARAQPLRRHCRPSTSTSSRRRSVDRRAEGHQPIIES